MIVIKAKRDWAQMNPSIIKSLWNIQSYDLDGIYAKNNKSTNAYLFINFTIANFFFLKNSI